MALYRFGSASRAVQDERPTIVLQSWHVDAPHLLQEVSDLSERQCLDVFKRAVLFIVSFV